MAQIGGPKDICYVPFSVILQNFPPPGNCDADTAFFYKKSLIKEKAKTTLRAILTNRRPGRNDADQWEVSLPIRVKKKHPLSDSCEEYNKAEISAKCVLLEQYIKVNLKYYSEVNDSSA